MLGTPLFSKPSCIYIENCTENIPSLSKSAVKQIPTNQPTIFFTKYIIIYNLCGPSLFLANRFTITKGPTPTTRTAHQLVGQKKRHAAEIRHETQTATV